MSLEIPHQVPRPADSGTRTNSMAAIQGLRAELNQLQQQYAENKRNADWGHVEGDSESIAEAMRASTWLEDEYPKQQLDLMRRFGEKGYVPWADEVGHLHFYLAAPDVAFDDLSSDAFKRLVDSWASIQRVITQHIRVLNQRQEVLFREQQQGRAAAFEDLGLLTPAELDRIHGVHLQEMKRMQQDIDSSLDQLQRKKEQMRILLDTALPFAEQHGFVDAAGLTEDTPRLIPVPSKSGPRRRSEAA